MEQYAEGKAILIDKPLEWTSFDVVKKIRNNIKIKKVGHAGTLDPLATGLLIICTGKFTKKIEHYQGMEKEYTGIIELGKTTPSYDLETAYDKEFSIDHITEEDIHAAAKALTGTVMQVPPVFSAIKIGGERVYNKARRKENVKLEPRKVVIRTFEITKIDLPEVHFCVRCSKGTYIRSLARDFGTQLESGAHLKALRRTKIGDFSVDDAQGINEFIESLHENKMT